MALIMVFQQNPELMSFTEISHSLIELLGVTCEMMVEGKAMSLSEFKDAGKELTEGTIAVNLPDLEADEGEPVLSYRASPRLDREEDFQKFINEILAQDADLSEPLNSNSRDIFLTCDDTSAGLEALSAIAYVVASETGSGLMVVDSDAEEDTVWFSDAEEFADEVFGEEVDEDAEEETKDDEPGDDKK